MSGTINLVDLIEGLHRADENARARCASYASYRSNAS